VVGGDGAAWPCLSAGWLEGGTKGGDMGGRGGRRGDASSGGVTEETATGRREKEKKERDGELTWGPRAFLIFHAISHSYSIRNYYFNRHGVHWQITTFMKCFPLKMSFGSVPQLKLHNSSVL
jgi:hypothetical protein